MHEARYWESVENNRVHCLLCPRGCVIPPGRNGFCRGRFNLDGRLIARSYASVTSTAMDPIEKKPLYHFHPGRDILSLGNYGCSLACAFCQNWRISQSDSVPCRDLPPESAVLLAERESSKGIAYTYAEPMVWLEYVADTAGMAKAKGLVNVLVTNGYVMPEPLDELLSLVDAMNIDVKSMDDGFYAEYCKGRLEPVLRTAETAAARGCHVEVTNLIIPTLNDTDDHFERLALWVAEKLGPRTPVHFSRYHPCHLMDLPATPVETVRRARDIARRHLDFVYVGNVAERGGENDTICPSCGARAVRRSGYSVDTSGLTGDGRCANCGADLGMVVEGRAAP